MVLLIIFITICLCTMNVEANQATMKNVNVTSVSEACLRAYSNLTENDLSKYIDASGKPGSGIYGGNNMWLGSFSACSELQKSRYCRALLIAVMDMGHKQRKVLLPFSQFGVCVPDVCKKDDVKNDIGFFINYVSKIPMKATLLPKNPADYGQVECAEDPDYSPGVVITIVLCTILGGVCLLATVLQMIHEHSTTPANGVVDSNTLTPLMSADRRGETTPLLRDKNDRQFEEPTTQLKTGSLNKILNCFSLIRNTNIIMKTDVGQNDLTYLHGIRVMSLFWIILFHVFTNSVAYFGLPVDNLHGVIEMGQRTSAMAAIAGHYAVDTFLMLSGLLAIYSNLIKLDKNQGQMSWFYFYFHRFCRLTPLYIVVIVLHIYIVPLLGEGPWAFRLRDGCGDYWWRNLLYINNFWTWKGYCSTPTWYLAIDMQFYVLLSIFIITLLRFGLRPLLALAGITAFASAVTTGILIAKDNIYPVIFRTQNGLITQDPQFEDIYTKPYCRIATYLLGMLLGVTIFRNMERKFHLKAHWVLLLWCVSIATALALVYSPHNTLKKDPHVWTKGEMVVYGISHRLLWGLCIGWLMFACHYGYAGLIRNILAAKFWIPLSRINYAAYLLQEEVMLIVLYNYQAAVHFTTLTLVTLFLAITVLTYASAFIFTTMVELPFSNLEALFWKSYNKRSTK